MTAFTAGVTVAPMSAVSMFVAPVAGRLADRIGGKYILMAGLTAFAAGMGYIDWIAATDSTRWSFLPGLLVSGFGMGCIFAPLATMAMRNVDPRMAGAASGVLNTTRQLGGVIGSAAVGALLQNRLAVALHDQAVSRSSGLPAPFRDRFVSAFNNAAKGGLEVGRGQTGESPNLPPDLPHEVVAQIQRLAHVVFEHGFVDAMRPSLALPILLCLAGALSCLAIRRQRREGTLMVPEAPEAVPTSVE
jgi:MFS family permease